MQDLQNLLDSNRLVGWQLDPKTKTIRKLKVDASGGQASFSNKVIVFVCDGCGAKNNLSITAGKSPECDYCGLSHIGDQPT